MLTLSSQLIRKRLIRKSNQGTKSLPFLRPNKGPASAENASDSRVLATHYICSFVSMPATQHKSILNHAHI